LKLNINDTFMNTRSTSEQAVAACNNHHLLDDIRAIRASVGDGLDDNELTFLLQRRDLPTEAGFTFLSFSDGFVTLTAPQQDPADWYPEKGWIVADKERFARMIAQKYDLSLCEPPDDSLHLLVPPADSPAVHHHLEFSNRVETVVVAHPLYLKVRLYGAMPGARYTESAQIPLVFGSDLLRDLSALYQARTTASDQ
jgi:hypothetical protein